MHIPDLEQGYKSPGWPLIVIASDEFGAPPLSRNSVKTLLTSFFHHSPRCEKNYYFFY